jgi:hypothetical protein
MEAARAAAMLAGRSSAQEAGTTQDSATLCVKDTEGRATLMEGEALERMSRAEAENSIVLASARADAEGLA